MNDPVFVTIYGSHFRKFLFKNRLQRVFIKRYSPHIQSYAPSHPYLSSFSLNPFLHSQLKLPSLLAQMCSHPALFRLHSLKSVWNEKEKKLVISKLSLQDIQYNSQSCTVYSRGTLHVLRLISWDCIKRETLEPQKASFAQSPLQIEKVTSAISTEGEYLGRSLYDPSLWMSK